MEYGIISSGIIRNHGGEKEEEEAEHEKPIAQQQVKVLKFRTFDDDGDDYDEINTVRERGSESEEQGVSYLLRENPKKSKRFVVMDSINKELNDNTNVCKECGKGFQSLKALCGHMACHSEKDRLRGRFKEEKAHSDTESSGPKKKKKLRRRMGSEKKFVESFPGAEREQQEVAISLMLLSRDSGGGCFKGSPSDDSMVESSSNNGSIVLESEIAKSNSPSKIIILREEDGSENSDSGYFRNGPKKGESSNALLEAESRPEMSGKTSYELRKRSSRNASSHLDGLESAQKRTKYECSTCKKTFSSHTALGGHRASHAKTNAAAAAANQNHCGSENSIETDEPAARPARELGPSPSPSPVKKGHECPICFRMFKSGQALGGHKRSHFVGGMIRREPTHEIEPEIAVLFDLNLPAPTEEEGQNGNVSFMEW